MAFQRFFNLTKIQSVSSLDIKSLLAFLRLLLLVFAVHTL
jgi:hypothetical protein